MKLSKYANLLILVVVIQVGYCQQPDNNDIKIVDLFYKIDDGEYEPHGKISIQSGFADISTYNLSKNALDSLVKSSQHNQGLVTFRAITGDSEVHSIIKSCSLYLSDLRYHMELILSHTGKSLIGVNVKLADNTDCISVNSEEKADQERLKSLSTFNATVQVSSVRLAPVPDTATYIKRMEEERNHRMRAETRDNRSFFAKYWMYILPAVVFLMMLSSPAPEGQGAPARQ